MRKHRQAVREPRLSTNGSNLTNVFATVARRVREPLSGQLAKLVPVLGDGGALEANPHGPLVVEPRVVGTRRDDVLHRASRSRLRNQGPHERRAIVAFPSGKYMSGSPDSNAFRSKPIAPAVDCLDVDFKTPRIGQQPPSALFSLSTSSVPVSVDALDALFACTGFDAICPRMATK